MTKRYGPMDDRPVDSERTYEIDEGNDVVEHLFCLTEDGPDVPPDGAEMIKAAIRPLWRQEVERQSRRRRIAWACGLAAAAVVVMGIGLTVRSTLLGPASDEAVATIAQIIGAVDIVAHGTEEVDQAVGTEIKEGSELRTDSRSRVALDLIGGQSLRLDTLTRIRLVSKTICILESGAVYVDSGIAGNRGIEIHTSLGVATDIGTQFEIRKTSDAIVVRVREGQVHLDGKGTSFKVVRSMELTLGADGSVARREIPAFGPQWSWAQAVAPPFAIEGRSAASFLDWTHRETGLEILFADSNARQIARETVLHGSLLGMTPMQAPAVILPSCGLESRLEAGALVIERME